MPDVAVSFLGNLPRSNKGGPWTSISPTLLPEVLSLPKPNQMELFSGRRRLLLLISAILISSLFSPSAADSANVEYCNKKANYPVKVKGIDITPYPIPRGEEVTFSIRAIAGDVIPKGKLVIDVSYWIFHVHEETDDLCTKTSCPISTGDFVISHKQTLPGITPPGSYTLTMKLLGENDEQLTCITFGFSIGFISSVADS